MRIFTGPVYFLYHDAITFMNIYRDGHLWFNKKNSWK